MRLVRGGRREEAKRQVQSPKSTSLEFRGCLILWFRLLETPSFPNSLTRRLQRIGVAGPLADVDSPSLVDGRQDGLILNGGQIAKLGLADRDLLKQSTHNLARSRLRQRLNDVQHLRSGDGADLISNGRLKLILDRLIVDTVVSQHNVAVQAFALDLEIGGKNEMSGSVYEESIHFFFHQKDFLYLMRCTDCRGFDYDLVTAKGTLHLRRA